jgi:superfamily II RNA helicase
MKKDRRDFPPDGQLPWASPRRRPIARRPDSQKEAASSMPQDLPPIVARFQERLSFPLDRFQLEAIDILYRGKSVLVTAPTGSGKTIVAEYAIFDALDRGLKLIYTTPLKALSNQKFRDLCEEYGEAKIGLVTGDIAINPSAPIVVMTTEILRNILYQDPARLDQVIHVVLDEVHYMNDADRGTVWEETIIHAPRHLQLVALSATVANAPEIAAWISSIRGEIEVVEHFERPVPLKQLYYTDEQLFPLQAKYGRSLNSELKRRQQRGSGGAPYRRRRNDTDPVKLVKALEAEKLVPAIYFIFSRRGCDLALQECLAADLKLTTKNERTQIEALVDKVVQANPTVKQTGPVTARLLRALPQGVAVHHAGLVPVLRHLVELLFQQGLIRVVFATETLAAGINMPARTTIISSLSKRTDVGHRLLTANEFMQMTGRAGRRGKDVVGHAVIVDDGFQTIQEAYGVATAPPDPIESQFTLSYNMVLNLMRNFPWETIRDLLKRSFGQYLSNKEIVDLRRKLERQKTELVAATVPCELKPELTEAEVPLLDYESRQRDFHDRWRRLQQWRAQYKVAMSDQIVTQLDKAPVGTLLAFKTGKGKAPMVGVLLQKRRGSDSRHFHVLVYTNGALHKTTAGDILHVSKRQQAVEVSPKHLAKAQRLKIYGWFKGLPPAVDDATVKAVQEEAKDMAYFAHVKAEEKGIAEDQAALFTHLCHTCPVLSDHMSAHANVRHLSLQIEAAEKQIARQQELYLEEFVNFTHVLEHFGHLANGKPTDAGELNAHIRATNGLLIAEVVRRGVLDGLQPVAMAAVISTLIFESRRPMTVSLDGVPRDVRAALEQVFGIATDIGYTQERYGIRVPVNVEIALVPTILAWGNGVEWPKVARAVELDDGDLVRAFRQLIDLLHQLRAAPGLPATFTGRISDAIKQLDRDVISATI